MTQQTEHQMRLESICFDEIAADLKLVELRLLDEKRSKISIGDIIEFKKRPNLEESITVRVTNIKTYSSWQELVNDTPLKYFGPRWKSKKDLIESSSGYDSEKEQKYQNVAFYISRVK
ncbi:hypothetical protein HN587_06640 [Candidatus Woesearchaeota archaeon]|mgnify:CR=1 FL=1|jgi:ASC-1-like (ASCH) protein|nr:hypothetical protein [Candidatus Woesearchaeota archaeon]